MAAHTAERLRAELAQHAHLALAQVWGEAEGDEGWGWVWVLWGWDTPAHDDLAHSAIHAAPPFLRRWTTGSWDFPPQSAPTTPFTRWKTQLLRRSAARARWACRHC